MGVLTACGGPAAPPVPSASNGIVDLSSLFIRTVPGDFVQAPDLDTNTGPTDLTKQAQDDLFSDAGTQLARDGFVRGYRRLWTRQTSKHIASTALTVEIYEFSTSGGAVDYHLQQLARGAPRIAGLTAQPITVSFAVPAIPGAVGINSIAGHGPIQIGFTKDDYLVVLELGTLDAGQAQATQLALAQYQRIP